VDARKEPVDAIAESCARVIYGGGTIVFPSDTGYCIGCDPLRPDAVERMHAMLQDADAELTLFLPSPAEFLEHVPSNALAILAARRLLPAPIAMVVSGSPGIVRVPDEPVARAILERVGPLAAVELDDAGRLAPDLAVENGPPRYDREPSVVDLTKAPARLLREGAISWERLTSLLGPVERHTMKVRSQS
jgi:L-threonylcarbamoyladenylate synthase